MKITLKLTKKELNNDNLRLIIEKRINDEISIQEFNINKNDRFKRYCSQKVHLVSYTPIF